jgi:hypothetical protein
MVLMATFRGISTASLRAKPDGFPIAFPFFSPGKRPLANGADLGWQVLFGMSHGGTPLRGSAMMTPEVFLTNRCKHDPAGQRQACRDIHRTWRQTAWTQETFMSLSRFSPGTGAQEPKVFWFFFQKRPASYAWR